MMARGIIRLGTRDSSPSEPADSKPAKARKPETAASARAERPTPGGRTNTAPDGRRPPGAVPAASRQQITTMSTRIRQTETTSNASTDLVVGRTPRAASTQMTTHAARASGYQSASPASPVALSKARPKMATPMIDTGGNTRYVPSSAHPARNPGRGPRVLPTKAYTDPAWLNSPASRTNP